MINVDFNSETIFFNGQEVGNFTLNDRGKFLVLHEIRINPDFRGSGYAQETMEQIIAHSDKLGKILALTPSSDFGSNKNKLISWYKSLGFVMNKGRNKDYETMELMFRNPQGGINEVISREIWTMNEDINTTFNVEEFDRLPSFAARKRYADEHLQKIGAGSARIVYKTPDGKVLKLAKNPKGIAQNEFECSVMNDYYIAEYITKIFNCHPDNLWVLVEEARKLTPTRFKQLTGVDIKNLGMFLTNQHSENNGGRKVYRIDNEEEMWENGFASGINDIMLNYGMPAGDLGRLSSYGEVIRNGQADVVLTDYGLSDEVYSSHYDKIRENLNEYFDEEPVNEVTFQMNNFLDNAAEDGNIKDGGYAGNAIMPQSVSEDFMGFTNANDGVIKSAIEYIKYYDLNKLSDLRSENEITKLHQSYLIITQNINRGLELSKNEIKLFDKLIEIQNFLKQENVINEDLVYWGADDASPDSNEYKLGAEGINEVVNDGVNDAVNDAVNEVGDVYGLSKETSDKIANHVAMKQNLQTPSYIGEGQHGYAYDGGDVVIKITRDKSEAIESLNIKNKNNSRIADIYNVFQTNSDDGNIFVILLEKLNTSSEIKEIYSKLDDIFHKEYHKGSVAKMLVDEFIQDRHTWDKEIGEDVMTVLSDYPKEKKFFQELMEISTEASENGIHSVDFINPHNLGYKKNGKLGFFDIGGGYQHEPKSEFQKLNIGESQNNLNIGYKVMPLNGNTLVAGSNSSLKYPLVKGSVINMPANGIYLSPHKDYVLQYYSELNDNEALLTLEYDPNTIITGDLNDREPEISVPSAKIVDYEILTNDLDEDGSSLYTNTQGTVDSGDVSWDLQEMVLDSLSNVITERILSWMPKSKEVSVKDKCKLGGNGDGTSTACNQGDVSNLEMSDIQDENTHKPNEPNVAEDNIGDRHYFKNIDRMIKEEILNLDETVIKRNEKDEIFNYKSEINDLWVEPIKQGKEFYKINFDLENNDSTKEKKTFYFKKNLRKDQPIKYEINAELWEAGGDWEYPVLYFKLEITHDYGLKLSNREKESMKEPKFPWDLKNLAWNKKYVMIPPVEAGNKLTKYSDLAKDKYNWSAWQDESINDAGLKSKDVEITDKDRKEAWKWLEKTLEEAVDDRHKMLDESVKKKDKPYISEIINEAIVSNSRLKEFSGQNKSSTEIDQYVSKFNSSEELLRSGGIPIDLLDKAAHGFTEDSVKQLMPDELKIKWHDDLENVKWEINKKGISDIEYANSVDLSEPIDVSYSKLDNGEVGFYIEDGHHRYYAAKILNKPLNVNLEIKINPFTKLTNLGYDEYHRLIWKLAKGVTQESNSTYSNNS